MPVRCRAACATGSPFFSTCDPAGQSLFQTGARSCRSVSPSMPSARAEVPDPTPDWINHRRGAYRETCALSSLDVGTTGDHLQLKNGPTSRGRSRRHHLAYSECRLARRQVQRIRVFRIRLIGNRIEIFNLRSDPIRHLAIGILGETIQHAAALETAHPELGDLSERAVAADSGTGRDFALERRTDFA